MEMELKKNNDEHQGESKHLQEFMKFIKNSSGNRSKRNSVLNRRSRSLEKRDTTSTMIRETSDMK